MIDKPAAAFVREIKNRPGPHFTEKVQIQGEALTFVVYPDETYTLVNAYGKHIPPQGLMTSDEIEALRAKARQ